jgi:hypothetical protein
MTYWLDLEYCQKKSQKIWQGCDNLEETKSRFIPPIFCLLTQSFIRARPDHPAASVSLRPSGRRSPPGLTLGEQIPHIVSEAFDAGVGM